MITYSTSRPSRPIRSSAARMTMAPRSVAAYPFRPPPRRPNGVRTAETMTLRVTRSMLAARLHRTVVQAKHLPVVIDRDHVELAEHVGAEKSLHAAVRIPERQVRLDDRR